MRILFVHEISWLDKLTYEIHDIPELLSLAGHRVTFIDFAETDRHNLSKKFRRWKTTVSSGMTRAHQGSTVDVLTPGYIATGIWGRLLNSLTFIPLFWRTVKDKRIDVVVLYGVPTNGLQTVFLARVLKVPVLFRAIDVSHRLRKFKIPFLIRLVEKIVYRGADHISCHNEALKSYCVSLGCRASKISIDFPRLDTTRFKPIGRSEELASTYGISANSKIVFFRGTLYRFCGLEKFIELFSTYLKSHPDVCVLIVGGGEAEGSIRKTVMNYGLDSQVLIAPFVDYESLVTHICIADVSINTFSPSLVTHCALPGRVLQSMSCGIPVVSTPLEGLMSYSNGSDAVTYRELDSLFVDAVIDLLAYSGKRKALGDAGRQLVESKGTWDEFVIDFQYQLQRLLNTK
jgi:glycosyltransferase involved in cell wall biosynthesis